MLRSALSLNSLKRQPWRNFATYKSSTGLVGLAVDPEGDHTLMTLSHQALDSVKRIPAEAYYRTSVEKWLNFMIKTCKEKPDIRAMEEEIDLGQIEEIIEMVKIEMTVIDHYYENKGWELVAEAQADADDMVASMADTIYFSCPEQKPPAPDAK